MRLIDTKTLKIKEFPNLEDVPDYAILSHTWEPRAEVTLQEFMDPDDRIRSETGFEKIRECCLQAIKDGYEYAWVDTCCIDKKNSTELSEAINSMWHWYQRSGICYVYLSDHAPNTVDGFDERKYWTRSWTLQELIAPKDVTFFNRKWNVIGRKRNEDMANLISDITGIPSQVLLDSAAVFSYSVAQRFSWAAGRKATRSEDRSYSLLGIFQVNMPMLYGERENAFLRLQKEILKESEDRSILAWRIDSPTEDDKHNNLLARSVTAFADCSKITRSNPSYYGTAMVPTGRGLRLEIPLAPVGQAYGGSQVYAGLLRCQNEQGNQEVIYLTKILSESGANIYERWHPSPKHPLKLHESMPICEANRKFLKDFTIFAPDARQAQDYIGRRIEFAHPQGPPAFLFFARPNAPNILREWDLTVTYREKLFKLDQDPNLNVRTVHHGDFTCVSVPLSFLPSSAPRLSFTPCSREVFEVPDFLFVVMILSQGSYVRMAMGFSFDGHNPDPKLSCHRLTPDDRVSSNWACVASHYMSHDHFRASPAHFSVSSPGPPVPFIFNSRGEPWLGNLEVQIQDSYTSKTGTSTLSNSHEQAGYAVEFSPISTSPIPLYDSLRDFWKSRSAPLLLLLLTGQQPFHNIMVYAVSIVAYSECMEQSLLLGVLVQSVLVVMLPPILVQVSAAIFAMYFFFLRRLGMAILGVMIGLCSIFASDWPVQLLNLQPYVDIRAYPWSVPILMLMLAWGIKWHKKLKDPRYTSWTRLVIHGIFGMPLPPGL